MCIRDRIRSGRGYVSYPFQLTVPKNIEKPPVFLYLSFFPLSSSEIVEEITDNGFAVARVSYQDIAPDQNDGFQNGPGSLFPGNAYDSWGKLGVWAWGLKMCIRDRGCSDRCAVCVKEKP